MATRFVRIALLITLLARGSAVQAEEPALARLGFFGDTPYTEFERGQLPGILAQMDEQQLDTVVHVGDIKSGGSRCDDKVYQDILKAFQHSATPLVYVPGDNEWTDCHRPACGSFDPVERLAFLRRTFFTDDRSLGKTTIPLERQAGLPENVRWQVAPVLVVALNIPGSDNNIQQAEEYGPRNQASLDWLQESFRLARERKLAGIIIAIQANPFIEADNEGAGNPGYKDFLNLLREEVALFPGQVLLVHGDTHNMQINQPLRDRATRKTVTNFHRVETYGSPFLGWIKVIADTREPELFRFETHPWPPRPLGQ